MSGTARRLVHGDDAQAERDGFVELARIDEYLAQGVECIRTALMRIGQARFDDRQRLASEHLGVVELAGAAVRARQRFERVGDFDVRAAEHLALQLQRLFECRNRRGLVVEIGEDDAAHNQRGNTRPIVAALRAQGHGRGGFGEGALALEALGAEKCRDAEQPRLQLAAAGKPRLADQVVQQQPRRSAQSGFDATLREAEARQQRGQIGCAESRDGIAVVVFEQLQAVLRVALLAQHAAERVDQLDAHRRLQQSECCASLIEARTTSATVGGPRRGPAGSAALNTRSRKSRMLSARCASRAMLCACQETMPRLASIATINITVAATAPRWRRTNLCVRYRRDGGCTRTGRPARKRSTSSANAPALE